MFEMIKGKDADQKERFKMLKKSVHIGNLI